MASGAQDRLEGKGKELKGSVKARAGDAIDDPELASEGHADRMEGKGQGFLGRLKGFFARS
jgi:uncharacterized protein YjbJ (UPF0337 family)